MALTRKALIITNPGEQGASNYCQGVNVDAGLYRDYFLSSFGGAWRDDEIELMKRPSSMELRLKLIMLRDVEYSVVVFCGHGYHDQTKNSTMLELGYRTDFDSVDLYDGTRKRTIILDCCRGIHMVMESNEVLAKAVRKAATLRDLTESRRYFDATIASCSPGLIVLFGCSIRELANDSDQLGGVYSYNLVSEATKWAQELTIDTDEKYSYLSVVSVHEMASSRVTRATGSRQNPSIQKPMSGPYFPFAIVA